LSGVQVLRAFAAFMVAVHHARHELNAFAQGSVDLDLLPWMAGVDIFFVVSGFIMVHATAQLFGTGEAARLFIARRLARIVPLYWALSLLVIALGVVLPSALNSGGFSLREIMASLLFWPIMRSDGAIQPVYSLGWTLNFEMMFYVLFAMALLLRQGAMVTVGLVAAGLAGLVALVGSGLATALPFGFWGQPIVLEFVAGMVIGLWRLKGWRLGGTLRWALVLAGIAILVLGRQLPQTGWTSTAVFGGVAFLLVAAAALGKGITAPSMLVRYYVAIGNASYALYLTHPFVLRATRIAFQKLGLVAPWSFLLVSLSLVLIVAVLVYRHFELPMTRVARKALRA
jgi:exopolysaccharide production protein ExoZ